MHTRPARDADVAPPPPLAEFDYDLPAELIAQVPAERRELARLMVVERAGEAVAHSGIEALPSLLRAGDLLVLNDTRVRPARLRCRLETGGAVELLLLADHGAGLWSCLAKPGKRLRPGTVLRLPDGGTAVLRTPTDAGRYAVGFGAATDVPALLRAHGEVPLPPYIKRPDGPLAVDRERYQTVFARRDGAIAAPTAGLHFTEPLLAALAAAGIESARLTLDVGPATFMPVRDGDLAAHRIEAEWAELPAATVEAIARARAEGRRVIAVGTTTTRALESAAARPGGLAAGSFWADAFIRPGVELRVIDGLLTNFHLPASTLLMLVCAFAGRRRVLDAYATAVRERYRFYSYGDAMLIL
jgi:S-adenosylmethionine:tRNA ribosyltransferase-isomerase